MAEDARIPIYINDQQAISALKTLQGEATRLRDRMKEALAAGDVKGYKEAKRELSQVTTEAKALQKASWDVNKVLNNLSIASEKDLNQALREVRNNMRGLNRDSKEYVAYKKQYDQIRAEFGRINGAITKQETMMSRLKKNVGGLLPAFGFAAILAGMKKIFGEADKRFMAFEERVDNLSALTALEGEELDWLVNKAKETSTAVVEGNVRIKQSADAIVDAYTIVGGKRPELLKVKEDLAAVTQEAIILSEAAKSDLDPAVAGLTMALNQFGMAANQSRRIINVLAAGSQAGAGDISYLTEAMEKSGTTANLMGISIESWAAAIESIAPYFQEARMAGNSFDKVLMTMRANQIGYVDGVFNLEAALNELETMYGSGTTAMDIFGKEHAKMGELIVKERDNLAKYEKAVTGSNVAIEQAAKNTSNEAAKRAQAQNNLNNLYLTFGEKIAPIITKGITSGLELLRLIIEYRKVLIPLTVAIVAYTTAGKAKVLVNTVIRSSTLLAAAAQALFTGNVTRATAAMRMFNTVSKSNVLILIISLLAAAGIALNEYSKKLKAAGAEQKQLDDINQKVIESTAREKTELELLLSVARDETKSLRERREAIKRINELSPEYLGNITLEKINSEEAKTAIDNHILAIERKARAQAAFNQLVELESQHGEDMKEQARKGAGFWTSVWNSVRSMGNTQKFIYFQAKSAADNLIKVDEDYLKKKEQLLRILKEPSQQEQSVGVSAGSAKPGVEDTSGEEEETVEDKIKTAINMATAEHEARKTLLTRQHYENKTTDQDYKAELLGAELTYLQKKLLIYKEGSKEYNETLVEILAKQQEVEITVAERTQEALRQIREAEIQELKHAVDKVEPMDPAFATTDQQAAYFTTRTELLKAQYEQELLLAGENHAAQEAAEIRFNRQMYQLKSSQIEAEFNLTEERLGISRNFVGQLRNVVGEQSKLGKALFIFEQGLAIAEVWVNIAKANAKAVAASPLTAGQPWVSINTGQGIANTALIAAQTIAEFTGKKQGGYTDPSDSDDTIVDFIHANEWVANAQALRNPSVRKIIDIIDLAQRNNTIASLNLPSVVSGLGKKQGGFSAAGIGNQATLPAAFQATEYSSLAALTKAVDTLNNILASGIKAEVSKYGRNSLSDALDDISRFNKNVNKSR